MSEGYRDSCYKSPIFRDGLDWDKPKEECGVLGYYSPKKKDVVPYIAFGLFALQHRGQESAGISYYYDGDIVTNKSMGKVSQLLGEYEELETAQSKCSISHVRYSTTGDSTIFNAMPFSFYDKKSEKNLFSFAHNGNIVNSRELNELLVGDEYRHISNSDSEVILNLLGRKFHKGIVNAIKETMNLIIGSYALVILTGDKLIAVRDPSGIRPLCLGRQKDGTYVVASESCALALLDAELIRDINAGEILTISDEGLESTSFLENITSAPCLFEYIYFSRSDSIVNGINVYHSRYEAGKALAKQEKHKNTEIDYVIGVPDTGIPSALGYSNYSKIPYTEGFVKSKYVGRSFINPNETLRKRMVRLKLNPIEINIKGKSLIVVDDSLVRGTTSKILIELLRDAGAKEIHFKLASPPVKHPCHFGISIAKRSELVANSKVIEDVGKYIGADTIEYLSMDNMEQVISSKNYCSGCFSGVYPLHSPIFE